MDYDSLDIAIREARAVRGRLGRRRTSCPSPWVPAGAARVEVSYRRGVEGLIIVQDYAQERDGWNVLTRYGVLTLDPSGMTARCGTGSTVSGTRHSSRHEAGGEDNTSGAKPIIRSPSCCLGRLDKPTVVSPSTLASTYRTVLRCRLGST